MQAIKSCFYIAPTSKKVESTYQGKVVPPIVQMIM